jgi:hypothetical protein
MSISSGQILENYRDLYRIYVYFLLLLKFLFILKGKIKEVEKSLRAKQLLVAQGYH